MRNRHWWEEQRADFIALGVIIGLVWEAVKYVAKRAAELAIFLAKAAIQAGRQIWNVLQLLGRYAARFAVWAKDRLVNLWTLKIEPAIRAAWSFVIRVQQFLYRHLGFLLRFVQRIATFLSTVWARIVVPILTAIEWARRVMRVLSFLGVKWADDVERWLAGLEQKIYNAFRFVQEWLNRALYWLNLILTPQGLINGLLLVASMDPIAGAIVRVLIRRGSIGFDQEARTDFSRRFPSSTINNTFTDMQSGAIKSYPAAQKALAEALAILERR